MIACLLVKDKFNVEVCIIRYSDKCSEDFNINYCRLKETPDVKIFDINKKEDLSHVSENDIIIDAVFGSGLSKPIDGFVAEIIEHINNSGATVISIDSPSGLFSDESCVNKCKSIVNADYTLSLEFPKYSMMFAENGKFVGRWEIIPVGLHADFINKVETSNYLIDKSIIKNIYRKRGKFSHKGNFGHALLVSGSYGKIGAAILSARACLRSGAGLLTVHIPKCAYNILQTAVPEAMVITDTHNEMFSEQINNIDTYNAIAAGPGIGTDRLTKKALRSLMQNTRVPMVFDADAINILGEHREMLEYMPDNSILTPHPKEFERIAGMSVNHFEKNKLQREFSKKHNVFVVLKGAHTSITCPDGTCYFNNTGNPGMATAGSGDVLTGIMLGILAQGYSPKETCIMSVYIHGLAGDIASQNTGYESLTATDIINNLGKSFIEIQK